VVVDSITILILRRQSTGVDPDMAVVLENGKSEFGILGSEFSEV
jgi:hypothetical protein